MRSLGSYYLKTEAYLKAERGDANLVVGRKGTGKSAVFLQLRDQYRNRTGTLVLDLKPEGYQLVRFKEEVLAFLKDGTLQHIVMAFWEYVILLEICYKILEDDAQLHIRDHKLYEPYQDLSRKYRVTGFHTEGDFSERLGWLMDHISQDYQAEFSDAQDVTLSPHKITELIHVHDIRDLRDALLAYLRLKEQVWLLFDNIDKGWPTDGLSRVDVLIIRALIDATRKIQREFDRRDVDIRSLVFLRNDVYELLVQESSDRGKEGCVLLDWTDPDLLRQMVNLRIRFGGNRANLGDADGALDPWLLICESHFKGEETFRYLVERSLMRPRFLLNLINECKGYAVNLGHEKIRSDDISKGLESYSTNLITDIEYELSDVLPGAPKVLYAFVAADKYLDTKMLHGLLTGAGVAADDLERVIDLLLWYGFLGIYIDDENSIYVHSSNVNYNMQILRGVAQNQGRNLIYAINPAFWPALLVDFDERQMSLV